VTIGNNAVGPVNLDLIARGVEAGKVPPEAFVRHEGWRVWRPLTELAVIERDGEGDDVVEMGRPSTPEDFSPADAIDGASDRRDALSLLMTAAVARGAADAALVHEIDEHGAVVVGAHGGTAQSIVGVRVSLADAAVVAAAAGNTVVTEPSPSLAGAATLTRLCWLAHPLEGALMIPIRPHDRLAAMIEIGRRAPFSAEDVASLEALVAALVRKLEGWS
jgi:hypothetical protein